MKIESGTTTRYVHFVAVDATDKETREIGLSSFTVYRCRNGGSAVAMTTPTIVEISSANMPGVYALLVDEDTTIGAGNDTEEMTFHITHSGMHPVTRAIELYRPKITAGNTLDVTSTGAAGIDWGNVENQSTSVDLSATAINLCDTVTTNTDMRGTDNALLAASAPTNFGDLAITVTTGQVTVGTNNDKTGYSISGTLTTLDALDTAQDTQHSTTQSAISALNDPTAAAIADAVWDELQSAHTTAGSFGEIATEIASILVDTAEIGTAGAGLTAVPWNASWDAEVQSECNDALVALALDHLVSTSVTGTDVADNSIIAQMVSKSATADWDSFVNTTDSLEAITDSGGGGPTAAQIADAVWDEAQADHVAAGSFGEVATEVASILADTNELQTDDVPGLIAALNDPTAAAIADAVWDELQSAHTTAGSFGEIATEIASILADTDELQTDDVPGLIAAISVPTPGSIADAVWDELQSGHTTAGTFGELATEIAAILVDTGTTLPATLTTIEGKIDTVDTVVDAILVDTGTTLPATLAGLNDLSAAQVNAEVLDVLTTDTFAELGSVPAATASIKDKLTFVYMMCRNKVTGTSTTQTLFADDTTTSVATSTLSDDGTTFTRGELT